MVLKLSEKIAVHLFKKGCIEEDEINIFKYGYSIIIDGVVDFGILFIAGLLLHRFWEVCVYAVVFSTLRQFTGGYHAGSRVRCVLLTLAECMLCAFAPTYIPKRAAYLFIYISSVVSVLIIIWKAPIENSNKKLDDTLVEKNKKKAVRMAFIFMIAAFIIGIKFVSAAIIIASSMFMVSLLIIAALVKNIIAIKCTSK